MRIGLHVQKLGQKDSLGIITERPCISGCWNVLWTRGKHLAGRTLIIQESQLVLAKTKA